MAGVLGRREARAVKGREADAFAGHVWFPFGVGVRGGFEVKGM